MKHIVMILTLITIGCQSPTGGNWFLTPQLDEDYLTFGHRINEIHFVDAQTGFLLVSEKDKLRKEGKAPKEQNALFYRSTDGGKSFQKQALGKGELDFLSQSADGKSHYMIRDEFTDESPQKPTKFHILKSTDKGESWEELYLFENKRLTEVFFYDDETGFAIILEDPIGVRAKAMYKTTDGGRSWNPLPVKIDDVTVENITIDRKIVGDFIDDDILAIWEMDMDDLQRKTIRVKASDEFVFYGSILFDPVTQKRYIGLINKEDEDVRQVFLYCFETETLVKLPPDAVNFHVHGDYIGVLAHVDNNFFVSRYYYSTNGGKDWSWESPIEPSTVYWPAMYGRGYLWTGAQNIRADYISIMVRTPAEDECGIRSFTDTEEKNQTWITKTHYDSGELLRETERSKEYQGRITTYYKNGCVKSVKTYHENRLNGPFEEFYEDGRLRAEGGMVSDRYGEPKSDTEWRFTGQCKFYFEDGSVDDIREYDPETGLIVNSMNYALFHQWRTIIHIKDHTPYTGYLDKTPVLRSNGFVPELYTCHVVDGIPDGSFTKYRRHGKDSISIAVTTFYKNGLCNGEVKEYYEDGLKYIGHYVDGNRHGISRWYSKSGALIREDSYDIGNLGPTRKLSYNPETGKLMSEWNYKDGVAEGVVRKYGTYSGIIESETEYVDGERHGIERIYYHNMGKVKAEREYKNGKQEGMTRLYDYETGIVYKEQEYKNDIQDGVERTYDRETGELIGERIWKEGSPADR